MDTPWLGDASSLLDAYRSGEVDPVEAIEASIRAIEASSLNAISHLDAERALDAARRADPSLPLGGLPLGIKELDHVGGWPANEASLALEGTIAEGDSPLNERLRSAGAILLAQTTSSEFGSVNFTSTRLHGTTTNPWDESRTPGGSSGGTAAAVAGGLLPLASGSDGGGSIRIPAGFTGLVGLKPSFGRIPKMTEASFEPLTSVWGCLSRSMRVLTSATRSASQRLPGPSSVTWAPPTSQDSEQRSRSTSAPPSSPKTSPPTLRWLPSSSPKPAA